MNASDARIDRYRPRRTRAVSSARCVAQAAAIVCLLISAACQETTGERAAPRFEPASLASPGAGPVIEARWPFWPTHMRIHPLTLISVDRDSGDPIIEARIEMLDQFGDTTKCVAQFRFELHDGEPPSEATVPLRLWETDLRDPEANRLHFDRVTHTYLFRLSLRDLAEHGSTPHLRVYAISVNGRRFTDTQRVR